MRHTVTELYRTNEKGYYTEDYIKANGIKEYRKIMHLIGKDAVKINTATGIKTVYFYGEKTWFDTKEERDAYREETNRERAEMISKNKVIKAINEKLNTMTEEELNKLLQTLWEAENSLSPFVVVLYRFKALKP